MPPLGVKEQAWALSWLRGQQPAFSEINEATLLDICAREGIGPLLYLILAKTPEKNIPAHVLQSLKARYLQTYFRNEARITELVRLVELFRQEGIPVLLLKGVALLASLYDDWGLRPFNDLDILVPETDLEHAHRLILQQGYALTMREYRTAWRRFGGARGYCKDGVWLDLHWRFEFLPPSVDAQEIFVRTQRVTLAGSEVLILQREDLLYHLLHHMAFHHGLFKLIWLVDISRIVAAGKDAVDWTRVARMERGARLPAPLRVGLKKARDLLGVAVPDAVLQGPSFSERLVQYMLSFNGEAEIAGKLFRLWTLPGIKEKVHFLLGVLFPGTEFLKIRYHAHTKPLVWAFFLLRPFLASLKAAKQGLSGARQALKRSDGT